MTEGKWRLNQCQQWQLFFVGYCLFRHLETRGIGISASKTVKYREKFNFQETRQPHPWVRFDLERRCELSIAAWTK